MDIFENIEEYIFNIPEKDLRPRYQRAIDLLDHIMQQSAMCDLFSSNLDNKWGKLAKGLRVLINEVNGPE